jgi:ribonuclease G
MSNKNFSKRSKSKSFRPTGGMKRDLVRRNTADSGRESMVGGHIIDEPVFAESRHEKAIDKAENEAYGESPKPKVEVSAKKPRQKKEKATRGLGETLKKAASKVIDKVKNMVGVKKPSTKEIVINAESLETRVAVLEKGKLEEFTIERTNEERIVASIYKGKVRNLENRLEAAFVDIGIEKNAFLHYWDITPINLDGRYEVVERKKKSRIKARSISRKDIPKKYPVGSDIVIQVTKGPIGTKGPRVTTHLAIPGRYLVVLPNTEQCGISKKIEDRQERARLREIIRDLDIPENMGVIIRTAGEGQKKRYFVRDLAMLAKEWERVKKLLEREKSPACIFREPDLIERTVRDFLTDDVGKIVIDDAKAHERVQELVGGISKRSKDKVQLHREAKPIFDQYNITRQLETTFSRKVYLKSGGCIIIDETEALVAIDVNTGSHKGGKDQSSTILKVNLEAAEEICRQLRLRNIGGLIVLDFIDMKSGRDRQEVYRRVRDGLRRDKAKTNILPISQLGLMEMTRQRHSESVQSTVYDDCPNCSGNGRIKSAITMSVEIQRKLDELLKRRKPDEMEDFQLRLVVNPMVLDRLRKEDEDLIINMEKKYLVKISFRADPELHAEQFKIYNGVTDKEMLSEGEREDAS